MAQIYIKLGDYPKAKILVNELLSAKHVDISTYAYKAELAYAEGNIGEANKYADIVMGKSSAYLDILYLKSKICKKQGKDAEAKRYFNQAQYIEDKRKSIYR